MLVCSLWENNKGEGKGGGRERGEKLGSTVSKGRQSVTGRSEGREGSRNTDEGQTGLRMGVQGKTSQPQEQKSQSVSSGKQEGAWGRASGLPCRMLTGVRKPLAVGTPFFRPVNENLAYCVLPKRKRIRNQVISRL